MPANCRDLSEVSSWAVELAGHPKLFDHERAASVLSAAATASWRSLGDVDGARALAERGLSLASAHDPLSRQRCLSCLADVRLFEGRFDEAIELYLEGGGGTPWHELSCVLAALAAAYGGRFADARLLNHNATDAPCPSVLATHHYVAGENDNLDHAWTAAEHGYREALRLSELSGAAFIHALATVGLVSVHAASGATQAALRGYGELIDYWERTGGWTQQWTTLRNLADLLDQLEDHDCAAMLRRAADEAPEAASTSTVFTREAPAAHDDADTTRAARAPGVGREEALDAARSAIARHSTTTGD